MKGRLFPLILFLTLNALYSQSFEIDFSPISEYNDIYEGSQQQDLFLNYLASYLDKNSVEYDLITYQSEEEFHSFGKSIEIHRQGNSSGHLIIVLHLFAESKHDLNPFYLMLELTAALLQMTPGADLTLLFLTGEEGELPIGTTSYLDRHFLDPQDTGIIYLKTGSDLSRLRLTAGTQGEISSYWFTRALVENLEYKNIKPQWDTTGMQIHRSGYSEPTPYITPYLKEGISAILLESIEDSENPVLSDREDLIDAIQQIYAQFSQIDRSGGNRNYLLFPFRGNSFFISEFQYLILLLSSLSFLLLIVLFQYRKILVNIRKFRKQGWMIVLWLYLTFQFLLVSTLLMQEIEFLFNSPLLWESNPLFAILVKVTFTFIFSSLFLFVIRGMPIPRNPHFYSYNAFIYGLVNLIALSLIDITLSYFWIWNSFFIILFTFTRRSILKWLSITMIPIPFLIALLSVMAGDYSEIQELLIQSPIKGNLFLAINLLPFLLLLTSFHYHRYYYKKKRMSLIGPLTLIISTVATLSLTTLTVIQYKNMQLDQSRIMVREEIDLTRPSRTQFLSSPVEIGDITLQWPDRTIELKHLGKQAQIELVPPQNWLQIDQSQHPFLDRITHRVLLETVGTPRECVITMTSDEPFILYNSTYTAEMNSQGTKASLMIGRYPPNPLVLEFTVNKKAVINMQINYIYDRWPYDQHIESERETLTETLIIRSETILQYKTTNSF